MIEDQSFCWLVTPNVPKVSGMSDRFNLTRFVEAQAPVYRQVVSELANGHKRTHWMWFIFPQLTGLGHSDMAIRYAISSCDEATSYLDHPVLGPRLIECTELVIAVDGKTPTEIFGSPDDVKFRSSMTLFWLASAAPVFNLALRIYDGVLDTRTVELVEFERNSLRK